LRITKFGHSCLLVEEGEARLLLDPGAFSDGFQRLTGLTAVLITHQHPDHLQLDNLAPLVTQNPGVTLVVDEASSQQLADAGLEARTVHDGDELDLGGVTVQVMGSQHAVIHPDLPVPPNVGYLVGGRFFYPGDAFTEPGVDVAVLGLPAGAPWMKVSEAIDYLRAVKPSAAVPMHEAVLAMPQMHYQHFRTFGEQQGTEFHDLPAGQPVEL
jgi:L-ascorbate metabolism protein UlaG (beta-lactamase superfamily)